jgi:uncharacterized repeat protein (TIGR03803 family)
MFVERSRPHRSPSRVAHRLPLWACHLIGAAFLAIGAITAAEARAPAETVLFSLPQGSEGWATPLFAGDGAVYGTTSASGVGFGVAYLLRPPHGRRGGWRESVLTNFTGVDGATPISGLTPGPNGSFYGTTSAGGGLGMGTLFVLLPPASGQYYWTERVLHHFTGVDGDGIQPFSGPLVLGTGGVLYGTTMTRSTSFCGVAFALAPPRRHTGGTWTETILHDFGGTGDGCQPFAGLVSDGSGGFFGATVDGGAGACSCGTIFQLRPPQATGGAWTESTLYSFAGPSSADGAGAYGTLARGRRGVLYGTTQAGGTANLGTVFALAPPGAPSQAWRETVLHSFTGGSDGESAWSPVTLGADGRVYGTTAGGGGANDGIAFALSPPHGGSSWRETVLYAFTGTPDGKLPFGGLSFGTDGALYGVTYEGGAYDGGALVRIWP